MSNNKLKILILRTAPNTVNPSNYNLQEIGLAKALIRKGHICDVAYFTREKDHVQEIKFDSDRLVKILWLHGFGAFYEGFFPSLKKHIYDYDIIQVSEYVGITSCWLNRHVPEKIVNYHGPYYYEENRGDILKAKVWDKTLLPLSRPKRMVVATKSVLAERYLKAKGISNVYTVGVGLDMDNLANPTEDHMNPFVEMLRENKGDKQYLLYIGALEPRRNIHFLLRVFAAAVEQMPECRLVLIGKGKKEYTDSCFALMDELAIRDRIIYKESLQQKYVSSVYECADLFLLPTRYEIFGMVLLEAMYFGLPVITTYNGGSATLMTEHNGVVIDNMDVNVWADNVCELIKNNDKRAKIGHNASKTIKEKYTWDILSDEMLKVYEKRLGEIEGRYC